jgi:hypothetical protein
VDRNPQALGAIRSKACIPRSISRAPLTLRARRAKPNIEITRTGAM